MDTPRKKRVVIEGEQLPKHLRGTHRAVVENTETAFLLRGVKLGCVDTIQHLLKGITTEDDFLQRFGEEYLGTD